MANEKMAGIFKYKFVQLHNNIIKLVTIVQITMLAMAELVA